MDPIASNSIRCSFIGASIDETFPDCMKKKIVINCKKFENKKDIKKKMCGVCISGLKYIRRANVIEEVKKGFMTVEIILDIVVKLILIFPKYRSEYVRYFA